MMSWMNEDQSTRFGNGRGSVSVFIVEIPGSGVITDTLVDNDVCVGELNNTCKLERR
jgi:hypothetical protein